MEPKLGGEEVNIIKRGENVIYVTLHRSLAGMTVSTKAHPGLETFMRELGGEETVDARRAGRYWYSVSGGPLLAYTVLAPIDNIMLDDGGVVNMTRLGYPLVEDNIVNLSFLRLVGISEGAGVTFGVRGVYSLDELRRMRDKITIAASKLYSYYMKPVDLTVVVSTQELSL